jgi:hypothetical protein
LKDRKEILMKILTLAVILALPVLAAAQAGKRQLPETNSQPTAKLMPLVEVIQLESFARTEWALAAYSETGDHKSKSSEEAAADLDKFIAMRVTPDNTRRGLVAEQALCKKHHASLSRLVNASPLPFLYTETPVRFASKDGAITLLLTTLYSSSVYNSLRLNAKQRAAKAIEETVLPAISAFSFASVGNDIKNFGVVVAYGSRDFSESDSILNTKAEIVAVIASPDKCRKLSDAQLTEEEFVAGADVYLVDRDLIGGVRKVKVSLDERGK